MEKLEKLDQLKALFAMKLTESEFRSIASSLLNTLVGSKDKNYTIVVLTLILSHLDSYKSIASPIYKLIGEILDEMIDLIFNAEYCMQYTKLVVLYLKISDCKSLSIKFLKVNLPAIFKDILPYDLYCQFLGSLLESVCILSPNEAVEFHSQVKSKEALRGSIALSYSHLFYMDVKDDSIGFLLSNVNVNELVSLDLYSLRNIALIYMKWYHDPRDLTILQLSSLLSILESFTLQDMPMFILDQEDVILNWFLKASQISFSWNHFVQNWVFF